jgi:hypothetical protein
MKLILSSIVALLWLTTSVQAQTSGEVGKIALSVVMPENVDGLDASQLSKIDGKLKQMVTQYGLASMAYNEGFVVYPAVQVYDEGVVEGGMQNIHVVTTEITLFIKQVSTNKVFSSVSKKLKGSGKDKNAAILNGISRMGIQEPAFKQFLETGKNNIILYYKNYCNQILQQAETLAKKNDYEQSIALLLTIPAEVEECHNRAQEKSLSIYKAYRHQLCSKLLQQARVEQAANHYYASLETLLQVDPSSSCATEMQGLIKKAESNISAKEREQLAFMRKTYSDAVELRKMQINAVKEVAVAYYQRQPPKVSYHLLRIK